MFSKPYEEILEQYLILYMSRGRKGPSYKCEGLNLVVSVEICVQNLA